MNLPCRSKIASGFCSRKQNKGVMQNSNSKIRFSAPPEWSAALLRDNPVFSDLCHLFPLLQCLDWPEPELLNQWLPSESRYQFEDAAMLANDGRYYEAYIHDTCHIPTRLQNWHDLFGALIWCQFPQTKQLLNQLHYREILEHGQKQRSRLRNRLTLLDECGVIIACEPAAAGIIPLLQQHQWQEAFLEQRAWWGREIMPVIFGHAIYEMATRPFLGLTAKCWFINVPVGFCQWSLTDAYTFLDRKITHQLNEPDNLLNAQQLTPLPLLGVPGWYHGNLQAGFYNNKDYFRPLRHKTG